LLTTIIKYEDIVEAKMKLHMTIFICCI